MERHLKALGWIWIAYNAVITVAATTGVVVLLTLFSEEKGAGELLFVAVFTVPGIVGGIGLLKRQRWARILVLVFGFVNLVSFPPIGTALGIYTLRILFKKETVGLLAPEAELGQV